MNKFLILASLIGVLTLTGCTKTTAFDLFSTDVYYEKAVSNMKKVSLMQNMETKALLHAVYLNNVDQEMYNDGEYFYIAVHIIEDAEQSDKKGLNNPAYSLKMIETIEFDVPQIQSYKANDLNTSEDKSISHVPLVVEALEPDDHLRDSMPIQNKWNTYYIVRFKKIREEKLELVFESDQYGSAALTFLKEE